MIKKAIRLLKLFCIGFMLAVCIVLGVAVIIPKRKEEALAEAAIIEENDDLNNTTTTINKSIN
jgi:cbb3-type cytochrome oxidase subunit 3